MEQDHTTQRIERAMAQLVRASLVGQRDDRDAPPSPAPVELSTDGLFPQPHPLPQMPHTQGSLNEPERSFIPVPPPLPLAAQTSPLAELTEPPRAVPQAPPVDPAMQMPATPPPPPDTQAAERGQEPPVFLAEPPLRRQPDMRGTGFSSRDPFGQDNAANALLADHRQWDPVRDDIIAQQVQESMVQRDHRGDQARFNALVGIDLANDYRVLHDLTVGLERGRDTLTDVNY